MVEAEDYQPDSLAAALKELPIREFQGQKGSVIVSSVVLLWDQYAKELLKLETTGAVRKVTLAIRSGLARAVTETTAL